MARILFLTALFPPDHRGGYEMTCHDVAGAFRRRGHETMVLTGGGPARQMGSVPPDGYVRRDLRVAFDGARLTTPALAGRLPAERHNQRVLAEVMDGFRPDVVSAWHMAGVPIGLLTTVIRRGTPLVCVVCDEWPVYIAHTDPWLKLWLRWPSLGARVEGRVGVPSTVPDLDGSASFCFVSHRTRDRCLKSSPWLFPVSTITYSGIDEHDFPIERGQPRPDWSWRLLCAGRLDPRKGFGTAVAALAHLPPEATLQIFSPADGPYRDHLRRVADEHGVAGRVSFGVCDRGRLRERYTQADAVVFPSVWDEPFGLVPLEAMACGTPVITTGTGGSAEFLVDGRTCLRFAPGDAVGLAAAVRRMASSEDLRRHLVERGWDMAAELTLDHLVDSLEEWHLGAAGHFADGIPRPRDVRLYKPEPEGGL